MCGIAGVHNLTTSHPIREDGLRRMLGTIRHRGPDQFGIYTDDHVGLGSARLSIIDVGMGQQPITNEDGRFWIVFNGEVFNYIELRPELEARGHRFTTDTDTEVVLHLYEDLGPDCLSRLNGDFALAIWDSREETLFLARDRVGVRPLFYTVADGALIFGSEIKALLADRRVRAEIDPVALDQIFTYWSTLAPRSAFRGIYQVPPAHYLLARRGRFAVHEYWRPTFRGMDDSGGSVSRTTDDYLEEFRELLVDATEIRLRSDVPVAAYLSGGLDSSTIAAIVQNHAGGRLSTFSIAFADARFDESEFQQRMAGFLGTEHQVVRATHEDIGRVFPSVVWHTETPILRTAPAPMFLLSKLVHDARFKVALTGEGADEFLAGYDIFKEAKVRRFWARRPESSMRPALLRRLYPDIGALAGTGSYLAAFFREGLTDIEDPAYSHAIRWRTTARTRRFFSAETREAVARARVEGSDALQYPSEFARWDPVERAQYLECTIFLSQYLLSSQGDRVGMAHSVEGRFPFLDHRVIEFCNSVPSNLKLRGLSEKFLLRQLAKKWLPPEIWSRTKRPYRAPIHRGFFSPGAPAPEYVQDLLSPAQVRDAGLFNPAAVTQLVNKLQRGAPVGETDDMAVAGILSAQLVHSLFVAHFEASRPLDARDDVKLCANAQEARAV